MKAIKKEDMLRIIAHNFDDGEVIFKDSNRLEQMWEQLGDDWYIVDGRWQLTKKNEKLNPQNK
ncbi:hypothetical protein [Bacillus phage vB_BceM_Bc431v3]|uniref:Uncharacterized protein n=1 Tax=Bacillus phage vB_BceM_Bc431v3 TaxID=1195072 RepID=M4HN88_9CAUD|nr:hypothetical protein K201_gp185 [Bacillus phage vB_BceM_Bc431v3]AFQ96493.1 hypothetical protein [Bacillus phage vB_BceM_Bc431v3]